MSAKSVTKEIMSFFALPSDQKSTLAFKKRLEDKELVKYLDGMHMLTIMFQSARTRRFVKNFMPLQLLLNTLKEWDREWSERDISTFVYGIRALECIDPIEGDILKLGAKKIIASASPITSRAIGNALYGLQGITSDTTGAPEVCAALAFKINSFEGDLSGQDIGIGLYGLQGMSSDVNEVRLLVDALALKVRNSETELDSQAIGNALYGMQSLRSEEAEVRRLVAALASKIADSKPTLCAQSMGTALYGMQRMSSESLEVRSLISALAEKVDSSDFSVDAQAIGNSLFGIQRMTSNVPEVRALLQAITTKLNQLDSSVQMDSKGIGSALYGLQSLSSDVSQVRSLLAALAQRISLSSCFLSGQGMGEALYGLRGMGTDCPELRALLTAIASRIDASVGKLDSQEIGNALFGLQSLSSEMQEARLIANKIAEKLRRSKAVLRSQHIGRAMLGLQKFSVDTPEIKLLIQQLTKRIAESDRTRLTSAAIADSLYGLQSMTGDMPEVQELLGELAKKIATTAAELTPDQIGRALFGLQSLSSNSGLFEESAILLDSDEVQFLISALWDKIKSRTDQMPLAAIAMGLQGLVSLKDPIANNIRQYLYVQAIRLGSANSDNGVRTPSAKKIGEGSIGKTGEVLSIADARQASIDRIDIVSAVRAMRLNDLRIPKWLATEYFAVEAGEAVSPVPLSRQDKLVVQKFQTLYPTMKVLANSLNDGFRLDMNFREISLNIELDGPKHRHPARQRFDLNRDSYLRAKKGYEVVRIDIENRKVEDVVSSIHDIVRKRMEKVEDAEIQKMYAKDEDIQKIYASNKASGGWPL